MTKRVFQNPANGYEEQIELPFIWALLFGPLYFISRQVWNHAIIEGGIAWLLISIVFSSRQASGLDTICFLSLAVLWIIYSFFASSIIQQHYLRCGWKVIQVEKNK